MSLLDDVSIVVTPNGYKAGELYAVVPVPTEGADVITNGDFATDSDWTKGTGWTISGGSANCDGSQTGTSNLNNSVSNGLVNNVRYVVKYTISNYSAGSIRIKLGNTGYGDYNSANGTYTATLTALVSTFPYAQFNADSSFVGSIDNVSVKEYTSADMDVTRATASTRVDEDGLVNYAEVLGVEEITNGDFATNLDSWSTSSWWVWNSLGAYHPSTSLHKPLYQQCCVIGKTYLITFDLNCVGLSLAKFSLGSSTGSTTQVIDINLESGSYSYFVTAAAEYIIFNRQNTAEYYVNNISVKEADRDNVPRIDYTGGGCPHILAEPQRTNLITYSEDFSQSYWTKQSGVTPTYNTTETLSPDGTYNATKFIGNGSSGVLKGGISVTGVIARSVYLKSITGTVNAVLKDPNLTVTQKTLTVTEEWQRFELIESNGTSTQGIWIDDIPASGIYVWGAQLEAGSYATSYIPTSGSTVTRNQDIFTRDGIGSLINSPEGVLFVEMAALSDDGTLRCITLSDGGITNRVLIIYNTTSNSIRAVVVSNAGTSFDELHTVTSTLDFHKIAIKWKLNDFAFWIDGVEVATDTSGAAPIGLDRIVFDVGNGTYDFYGKVKQLQVYNTALTDEQLEALTS